MANMKLFSIAVVCLLVITATLCANNGNAVADVQPENIQVTVDPAKVIVTVNGDDVTEGEIENSIRQQLASRPEILENEELFSRYRISLRRRVLNNLINTALLAQSAEKENLALTDDDIKQKLEEIVLLGMKQTGMTREELAADIQKKHGMTIEESLGRYKNNRQFLDTILFEKIVSAKFSDKIAVSDKEINEYYKKNLDARYTEKATVTASHILVTTLDQQRKPMDENKVKAAKEKIEMIKKELEDPKADFGLLAEKYSDCPSGKRSKGSLGAFPRNGAMVEPFAKAAFETKTGEISDIVETQFGYHIIKVTDRTEGKVTSLDEVNDDIASQLARTRKSQLLSDYVKSLRENAKIEYLSKDDDPVKEVAIENNNKQFGSISNKQEVSKEQIVEKPEKKQIVAAKKIKIDKIEEKVVNAKELAMATAIKMDQQDPPLIGEVKAVSIQIVDGSKVNFKDKSGVVAGQWGASDISPALPCIWVIRQINENDKEIASMLGIQAGNAYIQLAASNKVTSFGTIPPDQPLWLINNIDLSQSDDQIFDSFNEMME